MDKRTAIIGGICGVIIFILGTGVGSANVPEPEVITETKTVTETVEVEVTPKACLTALSLNEEAFGYLSESLGAIMDQDVAAMGVNQRKLEGLVPETNRTKAECRALAN